MSSSIKTQARPTLTASRPRFLMQEATVSAHVLSMVAASSSVSVFATVSFAAQTCRTTGSPPKRACLCQKLVVVR